MHGPEESVWASVNSEAKGQQIYKTLREFHIITFTISSCSFSESIFDFSFHAP